MKKNRMYIFIILSFFFSIQVLATQTICSEHFKVQETRVPDGKLRVLINEAFKIKDLSLIYNIKLIPDNRYSGPEVSKESLVDLFQMLGQTQFFNTGQKITLEKGTLYLGRRIDDLLSAQAEYTFDKPNKRLHLTRVSVVNSRNGQEQVLTKEPLDFSGKYLVKSEFNLAFEKSVAQGKVLSTTDIVFPQSTAESTANPSFKSHSLDKGDLQSAEVSFPPVIEGAAFGKVIKWSLIVPHLDHVEINVVDSVSKQNWAIAKGQFRRLMEFAKDRFFKQAFGLLVVYAIFDGMSGFSNDVAKYLVEVARSQESSISIKVKETRIDGQVTNSEQKFKIDIPKKSESREKK